MIAFRLGIRLVGVIVLLIVSAMVIGSALPSQQIAYEARHSRTNYDIHLLDVRWRIDIQLTRSDHGERHPAWSPDGQTLAFTSDVNGEWDIYTLSMTAPYAAQQQVTDNGGRTMNPHYAPDGTSMIFDSTHEGNLELYLLPLVTDDDLILTDSNPDEAQRLTFATGVDETPVWSPDGRRISFASYRDSDREIYVLDLTKSETRNITQNLMYNEWGAAWSPDNRYLTFASTRNRSWQVYRADLDSDDAPIQVTNASKDVAGAVWSPDGRWLGVEVYDTVGTRSLYLLQADAELATDDDMQQLTLGDTDDRFIAWRPTQ